MSTASLVHAETAITRIGFFIGVEVVNGMAGYPFDVIQVGVGAVVFEIAARFLGYSFGHSASRARIAVAEIYGTEVAKQAKELKQNG